MSAKFQIEKISGQFTQQSRAILKEQFDALPDGKHDVLTTPTKRYSATRYKHYFDCVLWQILNEAGHHYRIVNLETGEERRPVSTQELHDLVMKPTYNKVLLMAPGKSMLVAGSTTDLDNKEYFGKYLESIIADHSGPPYNIEFISYEDWKELHRANAWINFKNTYKANGK
jgi:hypothetical protein